MRKLVESTFVTLDGVIDRPQDWSGPYWDDEHTAYGTKMLFAADALVLGRETYDVFAEAWPQRPNDNPYTERINTMPKHVASRTLTDPTWNASVLEGDAVAAVAALKESDGGDLLKYGTGDFSRQLLAAGLVDELHLWIFPVVAGKGDRLLEGADLTHLDLRETNRFASGIAVHVYAPK